MITVPVPVPVPVKYIYCIIKRKGIRKEENKNNQVRKINNKHIKDQHKDSNKYKNRTSPKNTQ